MGAGKSQFSEEELQDYQVQVEMKKSILVILKELDS